MSGSPIPGHPWVSEIVEGIGAEPVEIRGAVDRVDVIVLSIPVGTDKEFTQLPRNH